MEHNNSIDESKKKAKVYLFGSIHYKLNTNPNYTMDHIIELINAIAPDIIAIEIVKEHMGLKKEKLYQLYPPEFPEVMSIFESTKIILPFNWIPQEQKENRQTFLNERKKVTSELHLIKRKRGETQFLDLLNKSLDTITSYGTVDDVNSLTWDQLVYLKRQFELSIIEGTKFKEKFLYYSGYLNPVRISAINNNIKSIIDENKDKKIVILTGAMHRWHIVPFIKKNIPHIDFQSVSTKNLIDNS